MRDTSPGRPLAPEVQQDLRREFGRSFGEVRVHADAGAARLARGVEADAFTRGSDIYFGGGKYAPQTATGRGLLLHELVHVAQQARGEVSAYSGRVVPADHGTESVRPSAAALRGRAGSRDGGRPAVQRQPAGQVAPTPDLKTLEDMAVDRVQAAHTNFGLAIEHVRLNQLIERLEREKRAEMFAMVLEIGLGLLAPGFAAGIAALAEEIPVGASLMTYRIAVAALDEERTKMLFEAGVKLAAGVLKGASGPPAGEDDVGALLIWLGRRSDDVAQALETAIRQGKLTPEQLIVTCAVYDASVTHEDQFASAITTLVENFKAQVQPLGRSGIYTTTMDGTLLRSGTSLRRACWLEFMYGVKRLAVVEQVSGVGEERWTEPTFVALVVPELEPLAIEKTKEVTGSAPETLPADKVDGVPKEAWWTVPKGTRLPASAGGVSP